MKRLTILALCAALAGCAATRPGAPKTAAPAAPASPAALALSEGIALYDKGDYNGAIKRLAPATAGDAPKATQLSALKYTAFSYCVTARQTLCRQTFDKAVKLDPAFDLEPGEKGHPLWGPVFLKAKKPR